jgi:hypothetical protein
MLHLSELSVLLSNSVFLLSDPLILRSKLLVFSRNERLQLSDSLLHFQLSFGHNAHPLKQTFHWTYFTTNPVKSTEKSLIFFKINPFGRLFELPWAARWKGLP